MQTASTTRLFAIVALLFGLSVHVEAQPQVDPSNNDSMLAGGFLEGHPDLLYRSQGLDAYQNRDFSTAIERFRKAAYYGDKASQAIVGEMLWSGVGIGADRVMALVWMDLAAERGYPRFVGTRNGYWNALTPAERQRARNLADKLFEEYGDAATEPRLARALRRERTKITGSRVGSMTSNVQIIVPGYGSMDASQFYNPKFWDPKEYRAWHDAFWKNVKDATVVVGEPEKLDQIKQPLTPSNQGKPR